MTKQQALEKLESYDRTMTALSHAQGLVYYDGVTIAPETSAEIRPNTMTELARIQYELTTDPSTVEMLDTLHAEKDGLTPEKAREVSELRRENERMQKIPKEEYLAYETLTAEAETVWHKAKADNDFASFEPYLQKLFDFNVRFGGYLDPKKAPYDVALDSFERGMTRETCDGFFAALRKRIVPLLKRVGEAEQIDNTPLQRAFPVEKQRAFSDFLMQELRLDRRSCIIGETEHPFTTNFTKKDVRITTHYHEKDVASSLYSVVHEGGHALYELGVDDGLTYTCLGTGVSMAIHESQSRFYENIVGRSRAFCGRIVPYLKQLFPEQMADVDEERFYRMVNRAEPSLIRTEADELTYCLHIMVRYELEKAMFDGSIRAKDLPGEWNRLYREYLGVDVPDDRRGVLQDSHWSGGAIGYFPSYALGSAYGAQYLLEMGREFDVFGAVAAGEIEKIHAWNREHIWRHGCMFDPTELFEKACGSFSPDCYADYLEKKYTDLYGL